MGTGTGNPGGVPGIVPCYAENPLAPHDLTMPPDDGRWLEQPNAVLQRLARMTGFLFQPHGYDRQRHFLPARNLRSSLLFSLDDPLPRYTARYERTSHPRLPVFTPHKTPQAWHTCGVFPVTPSPVWKADFLRRLIFEPYALHLTGSASPDPPQRGQGKHDQHHNHDECRRTGPTTALFGLCGRANNLSRCRSGSR